MSALNATELLRVDLKRLKGLIRQFEVVSRAGDGDRVMKSGVANEIYLELELHWAGEEEILFPALREFADSGVQAAMVSIREAHRAYEDLIGHLKKMTVDDEEYDEVFSELIAEFEQHLEEEEKIIFPAAERTLGDSLSGLGERIAFRRQEILNLPSNKNALPENVQNPRGGEQMRKR